MRKTCPECNSSNLTRTKKPVSVIGRDGFPMLPHLEKGIFEDGPGITPVVCLDCGLVRYFADEKALETLHKVKLFWEKVPE